MHLAVKCLLGLAVLAAPCVYDPSSPEPSPIAAFVTPASDAGRPVRTGGSPFPRHASRARSVVQGPTFFHHHSHKGNQTMTKLEKVLYTARTHTNSGGRDGAARSDDGRLDINLSSPGGKGTGTNPEQLFAAGWSACFIGAMNVVAGKRKIALPADTAVDAEVDLGTTGGAYGLQARLNVSLPGLEREVAQELVEAAHQVCPYSRATRGNIDVVLNVV